MAGQPPRHIALVSAREPWNLLFGILALEMDFISRDALITAMHAWVLDKRRGLGDILVRTGNRKRPRAWPRRCPSRAAAKARTAPAEFGFPRAHQGRHRLMMVFWQ